MSSDVDINMDGFCPYILLLKHLLEFLRLIPDQDLFLQEHPALLHCQIQLT